MPVDKFRRSGDRTTTVYTGITGINIANLKKQFLRRDGGNTAIGAIDMNSNIINFFGINLMTMTSYDIHFSTLFLPAK